MIDKKSDIRDNLMFFSWAVSVIATLGSLYFSEIRQFAPCELCWYQRIIMYPLVLILGIAVVKKDYNASLYSVVFSGLGILASLYHYLIQKIPVFANQVPACGTVPCNGQYINWLGFITIPFLSLTAFMIIFSTSTIVLKRSKEENR
ncbi:disulfide oxidoreductase [Lederbergia citrea]|uniref:Probable disulfide formation protein n=1 Tax=Lederbergia citrea TaxID=2833581 RepID=A0A942Z284_9BACI|nr:disulfide oxidoreductase [Lederbergia citrea]MBS4204226.1 disulfide bond formation protein B [Lederbergia citrea]MBS4221189.1 disulfide bond formation protein B [Lederbergia citrea]